jgi:hypothetical protein
MAPVLLVPILGAFLAFTGQDPASIHDLAGKSEMVLKGTVRLLNSSTVTTADVTGLAVVRLTELVSGPAMLRSFVGKDITVRLRTKDVKEGEERVFFADSWVFGDALGVVEVGSYVQAAAAAPQTLAQDVQRAKTAAVDRELRGKLERAQSVVVGRVAAVRTSPPTRVTEHDPQWSEAEIEVSEVLKGTAKGRVTLVYPASTDVMWYKTPKPQLGQDGVFILRNDVQGVTGARLAVSEPQDILPLSELARVKALLGR